MAVTFAIEVKDAELLSALSRVEQQFSPAGVRRFLGEWVNELIDLGLFKVPYPPQSNAPLPEIYDWGDGKLHKFPSLAAQQGFFGALRAGKIRIPYSRTGELEDAPIVRLKFTSDGALLDIDLPEGTRRGKRFDPKWIVGNLSQQSYYFRNLTGWVPYEQTLQQRQPRIEAVGVALLEAKLEQLG
jgi:hypothetical protein